MIRRALIATPLPEWRVRRRARGFVTVLGYHRVCPQPEPTYPFSDRIISATPEEFARELRFLRQNFDVITMPELVRGLLDPSCLPERPAAITFDDGYVDNHTYALPLLRDAGLPATFFVCTGLIGTRRLPWFESWVCCFKRSRVQRFDSPFDDVDPPYLLDADHWERSFHRFRARLGRLPWSKMDECLQRLRERTGVDPSELLEAPLFMSWEAVCELAASGMDVGGHTRTHPIVANIDDPQILHAEIGGCYQDLSCRLPEPPVAFAYPWGTTAAMSEAADDAIAAAGFRISFSFIHGLGVRGRSPLTRLPRVHVSCLDDFHAFRLRMATAPALA